METEERVSMVLTVTRAIAWMATQATVNRVSNQMCAQTDRTRHANAVCILTDHGFDCSCTIGYKPDGSETPVNRPTCIDCNECLGECPESIADKGACHVNVDCTNTPGSFNCTCKAGYVPQAGNSAARPVCIKTDECASIIL